ncbi:hypothetical protein FN846DRAFT_18857 [Sphaerosporella brunnea]|uniref:BTB domain-containing protein n=1 Tax=Sphaerosporella brunnea TaxID=1250544 RepID=A0A5J5EVS0_9PEZI|nr:hypothetical protein FN846DRAFT_18857 [Sphaerosporella brunnea]
MTGSTFTAGNRGSVAGMHTLVQGLTLASPTTPSPTPPATQTTFGASTTSIFNNPDRDSTPSSTDSASTPSGAGVRSQPFAARRLSYALDSGKTNGSAVKEVDDPTSTPSHGKSGAGGPDTPSRNLAAASPQGNPRNSNSTYRGSDSVKLEDFLYNRGYREGACSDITFIAFGSRYRLHRLILDRSPFFSSFFNGGPWVESDSSEITLLPEGTDPHIDQHSFELALARLYGHVEKEEEEKHAMSLLAAASYLRMQDLAESCVTSLLRNLKTSNMAETIKFVTNSYYGPLTDRLRESAKALLYRDGWEMPFTDWDGISGEIAAEIAGYEGFFVPSEYHRYCFVRELINWRIKTCYSPEDASLESTYMKVPEATTPDSPLQEDIDDGVSTIGLGDDDADIKPLRDLLETGIFYIHMSFEELQKVAEDTDILGRPTVSVNTIREALWQQTILRQRVLNAPNDSPELGITKTEYVFSKSPRKGKSPSRSPTPGQNSRLGIMTPGHSQVDLFDIMRTKQGRRYYIPTEDSSTTVIGDCPPAELPPHQNSANRGNHRGLPPNTDDKLTAEIEEKETEAGEELRYSEFPPFRFSAEFKNIRCLKERKRVYSKTVFYAGSYWNIYIQKVKSTKNLQLGVYLHRAKDREGSAAGRDSEQLVGIINANQKSEAEDGETTLLDPDVTMSTTISSRPSPAPEITVPALGHYVDSRPMIQTYFKIFSPSRKGKMLSMFSSRPDSFNFSQSWGWKSSSLILDEGILSGDGSDKDSRLRFMVVLGNV